MHTGNFNIKDKRTWRGKRGFFGNTKSISSATDQPQDIMYGGPHVTGKMPSIVHVNPRFPESIPGRQLNELSFAVDEIRGDKFPAKIGSGGEASSSRAIPPKRSWVVTTKNGHRMELTDEGDYVKLKDRSGNTIYMDPEERSLILDVAGENAYIKLDGKRSTIALKTKTLFLDADEIITNNTSDRKAGSVQKLQGEKKITTSSSMGMSAVNDVTLASLGGNVNINAMLEAKIAAIAAVQLNAGMGTGMIYVTPGSNLMSHVGVNMLSSPLSHVNSGTVLLGTNPVQGVVLQPSMSIILSLINQLFTILTTHVHGVGGFPTTPPYESAALAVVRSALASTINAGAWYSKTVFGSA